jgi:hypothetical protein
LKGYPAIDYSVRDLIYRPRNLRVNRVYGMSPVEQIITMVNIALRRQLYLLDYFSEGNIPDSLIGVPESWTPAQISSYQKYWDAYFDGDLSRRRRAKFVPGGVARTFIQTKEPELKGPSTNGSLASSALLSRFHLRLSPKHSIAPPQRRKRSLLKPSANPRMGQGAYRRYSGERIRCARSRICLGFRSRNRSRDTGDDPFEL